MALNSISPKAKIGTNVTVGDFTVIKDDVEIGNNVEIGSNVIVDNGARISDNVKLHHGAVISTIPQDLKFAGEVSTLEIGENTIVREYATLNRGTVASGKTVVGKNCLLMAYAHVAHDCRVGNNVIIANSGNLGGHVEIDDWAIVGGIVAVHQFVKIGTHTILAGFTKAVKDIPPYIMAGDNPMRFEGLNVIGLKRRGFTPEQIDGIKEFYKILYRSGLNISDAVKKIKESLPETAETNTILGFISGSTRGILTDK
ncbi:MAG: acyl-ACP--UDP-N-acetylglucosamine O-acyltransferase [Ignavibacteriota bacterium]|nr:acyl-ACP--UDP-N-acetylglucosamine O-acyltransferase [Ignavibacteriota bacterium]